MFRISVIRRSNKRLGLLTVLLVADIPDQLLGFSRNRLGFFHHRSLLVDQIQTLCSIFSERPAHITQFAALRSRHIFLDLAAPLLQPVAFLTDSTAIRTNIPSLL